MATEGVRMTKTVVGVLLAVAVLAGVSAAGTQLTGPGTIRITSREVANVRVDNGAKGLSAGDMDIVREQLYNTRITPKAIGHAELICTFTIKTSRYCQGTFFLPRGKLVVAGPIYFRQLYELAVLGGTGIYDNVRGSVTATTTSSKPRREVLIFRLTV
jgi:hypothetical protein